MNFKAAEKMYNIGDSLSNFKFKVQYSKNQKVFTYTPFAKVLNYVAKKLKRPYERLEDEYNAKVVVLNKQNYEDYLAEKSWLERGCINCPFGNGEGGCTVPSCDWSGKEPPLTREWIDSPDYVGD